MEEREAVIGLVMLNTVFVGVRIPDVVVLGLVIGNTVIVFVHMDIHMSRTVNSLPNQMG